MDNNQTTQNPNLAQVGPLPITPQQPATTITGATPTVPPVVAEKKKPSLLLIIVGILILGILVAGGIYFYSKSKSGAAPVAAPVVSEQSSNIQDDLNVDSVALDGVDGDFTAIDKDLNSL